MAEAFVEDAEHDVHRQDRAEQQDHAVGLGLLQALVGAGEIHFHAGRQARRVGRLFDQLDAAILRHVLGQVVVDGGRFKLVVMTHPNRAHVGLDMRQRG